MIIGGQLLKESLVWTNGMSAWTKVGEIDELKTLFSEMPPIPTTD